MALNCVMDESIVCVSDQGLIFFPFNHYWNFMAGAKKKSQGEGKPFIFQVGKGLVIRGVSICIYKADCL